MQNSYALSSPDSISLLSGCLQCTRPQAYRCCPESRLLSTKVQGIWNLWSKLIILRYWKKSWAAIGQRFITFPQIWWDNVFLLVTLSSLAWRRRHGIAEKFRRKLIRNFWKLITSWVLICTLANLVNHLVVHELSYSQNLPRWRSIFSFQLGREKLTLVGTSQIATRRRRQNLYVRRGGKWVEPSWPIDEDALKFLDLPCAAKVEFYCSIHDVYCIRVVQSWVRLRWEVVWVGMGLETAPSPSISPCLREREVRFFWGKSAFFACDFGETELSGFE